MNAFPFGKRKCVPCYPDRLVSSAYQVHFDASFLLIVWSGMSKRGKFEITPKLTIDPPQ